MNKFFGFPALLSALLLPFLSFGQAPPILRQACTTNADPVATLKINTNQYSAANGIALVTTAPGQVAISNTVAALTNAGAFQPASPILTNVAGTGALTNAGQFIASNNGLGTNAQFYGSPGGTNWTGTSASGWLNTNTAGGYTRIQNGTEVAVAGTTSVPTITAQPASGCTTNVIESHDANGVPVFTVDPYGQTTTSNLFRSNTNTVYADNEYVTADYVTTTLNKLKSIVGLLVTNAHPSITGGRAAWATQASDQYLTNSLSAGSNFIGDFYFTNSIGSPIIPAGSWLVHIHARLTSANSTITMGFQLILYNGAETFIQNGDQAIPVSGTTESPVELGVITTTSTATSSTNFIGIRLFITRGGGSAVSSILHFGGSTSSAIEGPPFVVNQAVVTYTLATNNPVSTTLTNQVMDFNQSYAVIFATNDLNFVQTTNREAGFWRATVAKIYAGPTNRQIWLNPSWTMLGSTTNYTLLVTNKVAILSLAQDGLYETNVAAVLVVQP